MSEVRYNGIVSKLRVDDSDLTRVELRLRRLSKLGHDASLDIGRMFIRGLRSPELRAAFDNVEKRIARIGQAARAVGTQTAIGGVRGSGESFLDRTVWRIKQMEDRQRVRDQAIEAARLRLSSGRADDNLTHLRGLSGSTGGADGGMGGLGMMLSQAGGMALYNSLVGAMQTVVGALTTTARVFHDLNLETERGVTALQGAFMSADRMDAATAGLRAQRTYRRLERAAAQGPGEASDYLSAFQQIYTPLRQRGASMAQIEALTRQSIAAGEVVSPGRGKVLGPMDIYQALTSGVNVRNTPIANMALQNAGYGLSDFRAASPNRQIEMLLEGFDTYNSAISELARTVSAQEDTFADNMKRFVRGISGEAFEGYRAGLVRSNEIMDDLNEENSHFRDGLRLTTKALSGVAEDISRGFSDGLLRVLPSVGNTLSQLGRELGILRDDTSSLSEAFGRAAGGMLYIGAEVGLLAARFGSRLMENPGNPTLAGARAVYDWATMARIPGLNEEGIPLSLLAPGGAGSDDGIPDLLRKPENLGSAIGSAAGRELTKHPKRVQLDVNVEWGNSRSVALAMQQAVNLALDAEARAPRSSFAAGVFRTF